MRLLLLACLLAWAAPAAASTKASYQHYLKALLHANQGDSAEALKEYEAALQLDPQSAFIYQQAAELALETGQTDKALQLAQRFVELSSASHQAAYLLGNVRWARGEWRPAQAAFERALQLKPDFKEALFSLGGLLSSQSPEKAKKYLQDYLKQNPDNAADAEYQIALIEQKAGRAADAALHLKAAHRLDPDNLQTLFTLAQVYELSQDTAAALGVYHQVLERDPRNVALLNHVGEMHVAQGDPAKAREQFLKAKAAAADNPTACLWLALLAEQDNDFEAAVAHLKGSADLEQDPTISLRLSYYLTQANRLKEAVEVLERAHARWPANEDVTYFLALGYDDLKQTPQAVRHMLEVLKTKPDHRDARFQLGAIYEKQGNIKDAEVQFREILKSHPNDAGALNYLGYSLVDRGLKLDDALGLIERAVQLDPNNGAYLDSLGWAHFKLGRHEEARQELEASAKLLPDDETVWDHLGEVYSVFGDTAAAWSSWKRAQALAPDRRDFRDKLAKAERHFAAEELAERHLQLLEARRGWLTSFGGPCLIEGKVGGTEFRFQGIVHYRSPRDLSIDVLGPLFAPMFRIALVGEDGFEMDPLKLEGVDDGALRDHLYQALRFLRAYFDGSVFKDRPARFRRGWRAPSVETRAWSLEIDKLDGALRAVRARETKGLELRLGDYRRAEGRWLPAAMSLHGRGFALGFRFPNPSAKFE